MCACAGVFNDTFVGTTIRGLDVDNNGFKDLVLGCPYARARNTSDLALSAQVCECGCECEIDDVM